MSEKNQGYSEMLVKLSQKVAEEDRQIKLTGEKSGLKD